MRVSTGEIENGADIIVQSTTLSIRIRKRAQERITLANHEFLLDKNVYYSDPDDHKIDDVVNHYEELNIVSMPSLLHANLFTNKSYFQAEIPKRLIE
jgi:hypothetical protein